MYIYLLCWSQENWLKLFKYGFWQPNMECKCWNFPSKAYEKKIQKWQKNTSELPTLKHVYRLNYICMHLVLPVSQSHQGLLRHHNSTTFRYHPPSTIETHFVDYTRYSLTRDIDHQQQLLQHGQHEVNILTSGDIHSHVGLDNTPPILVIQ